MAGSGSRTILTTMFIFENPYQERKTETITDSPFYITWIHPPLLLRSMLVIFFYFLCFVCLLPVSCVPNVASISGLSICKLLLRVPLTVIGYIETRQMSERFLRYQNGVIRGRKSKDRHCKDRKKNDKQ